MNTPDFYPNRKVAFDERLEWIEHGATPIELAERLEQYWREHNGQMNSEIVWECFTDLDQAKVGNVERLAFIIVR